MKNILNNKILIILTFFAVILGFGSNVFASVDYSWGNNTITLPDLPTGDYTDYIIYNNTRFASGSQQIQLITYNSSNNVRVWISSNGQVHTRGNATFYNFSNNSWSSGRTYNEYNSNNTDGASSFIFSTFDLVNENNEVVFQRAPQEQEVETQEITQTLVEQATQAEMKETLLGTIKTYLIYLVLFVVSMIAIWKAVKFLKSVLRAS